MDTHDNPESGQLRASQSPDEEPPTPVRWIVLAIVAFASASAYLTRYCLAPANTTIQAELGFDDSDIGALMSGFALGYFLFQIPGGWLGSRFGTRFGFAFISCAWSLCNVGTAAVSSLGLMYASRFCLGMFQAGLTPISAKILKDWIPQATRGKSSAAIGACMSIGGAFTIGLTGWLIDPTGSWNYGWRGIFAAYALVGIVWSLGFFWYFRTYPRDHPAVNQAELSLITGTGPAGEGSRLASDVTDKATADTETGDSLVGTELALSMLKSRSVWGLCVQSFFRAAGYAFFVTWFFAFLEYSYGISKADAGLLNMLPLISVVVGTLSGGFVVDLLLIKTRSKWISRSGTACLALGICGVLTLASAWTSTAWQLASVMAIGAMFSGLGNPAAWAATIDLGGRRTALFMGTMNMAGCLAGVLLPRLLGEWFARIKQSDGEWSQVIYLHAAFYFAAAVCWLFVNPSDSPSERRTPPGP